MAAVQTSDISLKDTLRLVAGLFLALFTLQAVISLVSYLFTWMADQSLDGELSYMSSSIIAANWGGKGGYSLARYLFAAYFGFGAFAAPVFTGMSAVALLSERKVRLVRGFFLCLSGCVAVSLTCAYVFSFFPGYAAVFGQGAGGSYGYYANEWLCAMIGRFGTGCVVVFLLCTWGMFFSSRVTFALQRAFNSLFVPRRRKKQPETADQEGENTSDEDTSENGAPEGDVTEDGQNESDAESGTESGTESDTGPGRLSVEFLTDDCQTDGGSGTGDDASEQNADQDDGCREKDAGAGEGEHDGDASEGGGDDDEEGEADGGPTFDVVQTEDPDSMSESKWRERYDPRLSLSHYKLPSTDLLDDYRGKRFVPTREELNMNNQRIIQTLKSYKISITSVSAKVGPTVTLFEVVPAPGVKVSQIKSREEDIARALAAVGVRVVFIPGSNAIGIEVANAKPSIVSMRSVLEDPRFRETKMELPIAIGRTISNETMMFDLAKMPHLLVAGATGQGKSVGLNAIITSLLYKKHPSELKLVLVDPKKVELSLYSPIENHYLAKLPDAEEAIITDTDRVVYTLKSLCKLMDHRYNLLKAARVRNIKEYNEKFLSRQLNPLKGHDFMPYIVVIIDEFADLLMTAGRDVEDPITRLAQLARAIGIHLVIATQRPTTNIITGTIKANFPARIAFKVMTGIDSKTILDQTGANRLIGRGDMLISTGSTEPVRVQCALVDTPEVTRVTDFVHGQTGFGTAYLLPEYSPEGDDGSPSSGPVQKGRGGDRDELFDEAARLVVMEQAGSTSLLQRKMGIGFARAGRLMDQLHEAGIVGPSEGSKVRQVHVTSTEALERILDELDQSNS